jgi:iron complex outermembrane receptor protein
MKLKNIIVSIFLLSIVCPVLGKDALDVKKGVFSNPAMVLRGEHSGVRVSMTDGGPSGIVNTNIRGLNAVRGVSEPLWIVDGVELYKSTTDYVQPFWQYEDRGFASYLSQMEGLNLYDIESIEVIKDISSAAVYGAKGANGVVIVKTKRPVTKGYSVDWNTNVGVASPTRKSEWLIPRFHHNHSFSVSSLSDSYKWRLSGFFRDEASVVKGVNEIYGGARVNFETRLESWGEFGLSASVSVGRPQGQASTAWYGEPSMMLSIRGINPINGDNVAVSDWASSYDDYATAFRTTDNVWFNLNFTPYLSWKTSLGIDNQTVTRYIWYGNDTLFGKENNGAAAISYASLFSYVAKSYLQFAYYLNTVHHISASAGAELSGELNRFNNMNGVDFFSHDLRAKSLAYMNCDHVIREYDYSIFYPSFSGRIAYDWDKKVGVSAHVKTDRVAGYENKTVIYPAAEAYVNFARFFDSAGSILSSLTLKGGYGQAGYRRILPYDILPSFTGAALPKVSDEVTSFYDAFNRIHSEEVNLPISAGLLDDRITAELGIYDKTTSDRLSVFCFGDGSALSGIWVKSDRKVIGDYVTEIRNRGVELSVNADILQRRNLRWSASLNAAFNDNRLETVDDNEVYGGKLSSDGFKVTANVPCNQVSSLYGYVLDEQNTVVGEGIIGNTIPKVHGSLGTVLSYGRFALDIQLDGAAGFSILNFNRMVASREYDASSAFVERGDYLRLSHASVSYQIPTRKVSWIKALNLSLSATNLFTVTGYSGWNPDVNSFGYTNLTYGIDHGSYPLVRSIMFGINAKF